MQILSFSLVSQPHPKYYFSSAGGKITLEIKKYSEIHFHKPEAGLPQIVFINKEPWYVAQDVCNLFNYENPTKAIRQHCKNTALLNSKDFFDNVPHFSLLLIPYLDLCRLLMHASTPKFRLIESSPPSSAKRKFTQSYIVQLREIAVWAEPKDDLCAQAVREFADFIAEKHLHEVTKDDPRIHKFEQRLQMIGNSLTLLDIAEAFSDGEVEKFMEWLRAIEVLPKTGEIPYREYLDSGKFLLVAKNYGRIGYCAIHVTPQGIWWLRELWLEHLSKAEEMNILGECIKEYLAILD